MSPLALAIALALTAAALAWLLHPRRRGPGETPATALPVDDFAAIDARVASSTCACGTRLRSTGEGSVERDGRALRRVGLACPRCGRERALYFDLG